MNDPIRELLAKGYSPGAIACNIESHFNIYIEEDGRLVK